MQYMKYNPVPSLQHDTDTAQITHDHRSAVVCSAAAYTYTHTPKRKGITHNLKEKKNSLYPQTLKTTSIFKRSSSLSGEKKALDLQQQTTDIDPLAQSADTEEH